MRRAILLFGLMTLASLVDGAAAETVSFTRDVAPILVRNCLACHGTRDPQGDFRLVTFDQLFHAGESELAPIAPGRPDESNLVTLVSASGDDRMPKDGDPLSPAEIAAIRRWIEEGAPFDGPDRVAALTSFAARPPNADPPERYRRPIPVTALAFHPSGNELAVSGYHEVTIWNPADGTLVRRIKNVPERVYGLAYTPDGRFLAVSGGQPGLDGQVKLFDPADGSLVRDLATAGDVFFRCAIQPGGNRLVVGGADRSVRLFDIASGREERRIEGHADWVVAVAWSPGGGKIATASRDRSAKVLRADTGDVLLAFSQHYEPVTAVGFLPGGERVISGGLDRRARYWKLADGEQSGEAVFGREIVDLICDGDKIFTACADRTVQQHRGGGYAHFKTYDGFSETLDAIAYHAPSDRLAAASFNGEIRIVKAEEGTELIKFIAAP